MTEHVDIHTTGHATPTEVEETKSIRTMDRKRVDRLGKSTYKVVVTDGELTSDDPDAP